MEAPAVLLLLILVSQGHSCVVEKNVEYFDNEGVKFNTSFVRKSDWASCASACKADDPRCNYWTFFSDTNECFFKSQNTDRRTTRSAVSGERDCAEDCVIEQDIEIEGYNLKETNPDLTDNVKVDDWKACAKECAKTEFCNYWSFLPANSSCYFKTSDYDRLTTQGAVSGLKICGI